MMPLPTITLYPHTETGDLDIPALQQLAAKALPLVLPHIGPEGSVIPSLEEIEISLVDDATIAQVHAEFMDDPTATDVITFHHGEVLISLETAARQAQQHGQSHFQETLLYIVHSLLHLNGHEDASPEGYATMAKLQSEIARAAGN